MSVCVCVCVGAMCGTNTTEAMVTGYDRSYRSESELMICIYCARIVPIVPTCPLLFLIYVNCFVGELKSTCTIRVSKKEKYLLYLNNKKVLLR